MKKIEELSQEELDQLSQKEYVKLENDWIERSFNCDITTPYLTMEQIELLEYGFDVTPNKEMPEPDEVIKEQVDRILSNM